MNKKEIKDINLNDIPYTLRKWKPLSSYRNEWYFLPISLRDRVAEQLMTANYIATLEEWLKPSITIEERQRVLLVQITATIYEGVLSHLVNIRMSKCTSENPVVKRIYDNSTLYNDKKRTFKPTMDLAFDLDLISESWKTKLERILEIRNWVHLSKEEKPDLVNWIMNKTCNKHIEELIDFREFIKEKFI
jgi:hypothetical protein